MTRLACFTGSRSAFWGCASCTSTAADCTSAPGSRSRVMNLRPAWPDAHAREDACSFTPAAGALARDAAASCWGAWMGTETGSMEGPDRVTGMMACVWLGAMLMMGDSMATTGPSTLSICAAERDRVQHVRR